MWNHLLQVSHNKALSSARDCSHGSDHFKAGLFLLVLRWHFVSNLSDTGLLIGCSDDFVQNYELLFQLGFFQIGDCDHGKNFLWLLPRDVCLFREMMFTHHLARFSCVILLLCGDILPNPGPPRYLCGVCNRSL